MTIKRKFVPVRHDNTLEYVVNGDVITVTHTDNSGAEPVVTTDVFDFSAFPNGEADVSSIETNLPLVPFISARRVDGVLEVEVIKYHVADASQEERFPQWEVI